MSKSNLRRELTRLLKFRIPQRIRYLLDAARSTGPTRLLLVSDLDAYCSEQQLAPLHRHRSALRERLNLVLDHRLLEHVLAQPHAALAGADVIGIKLSFRTPLAEAERVVRTLAAARPAHAKLIYFDGDDDAAIQWPSLLPLVDVWLKKHVFRDPGSYGQRFVGKNNLTTYVAETHGVSFADNLIPSAGPVSARQLKRVQLGYNLALDDKIFALYRRTRLCWQHDDRPHDVVCRASLADWLFHLRKDVAPCLAALPSRYKVIVPTERVSQQQYDRELASSKICVSPFGFGEICWRDFEAVLWGCLLIKPDMSHIRTQPDIFVPYETYVPVKWDFSDLQAQCERFLADEPARRRIVARAHEVLTSFYEQEAFFDVIAQLLMRAGVPAFKARQAWASAASIAVCLQAALL